MEHDIKSKVASSFLWVGISSFLSRASTIVATLILAGLLSPDDFGVVAIANVISSTLGLFRDLGMNQALIYQKDRIEDASDTAMILSVAISALLFGIGYLLAGPAALFFRNPAVEDVIKVLPFSLVITAFSSIPTSLLEKEMNFKRRALPEIISFFTYFVVSVTLALLGFAYWSIVLGHIAHSIVNLIVVFFVSPWHPSLKFHPRILSDLLKFGKYAMSNTIIVFIFRNVDDFSLGRLLGTASLGFYNLAYRISNVTATQIAHMFSKVTFPAMVKMKDNPRRVIDFYLKTFNYLSIINFPLAVGIISLIPSFFHIFYGNKWDAAILPTQILAVFGLVRGLFSGAGSVFMTIGRIRETFFILLGQLILLLLFIYPVIVHFKTVGLCVLLSLLNIAMALTITFRLESLFPKTTRRMLKLMTPPLIFSIIAIFVPVKLLTIIFGELTLWSFIGVALLSFLLYLFATIKKDRQIIREIRDLYANR